MTSYLYNIGFLTRNSVGAPMNSYQLKGQYLHFMQVNIVNSRACAGYHLVILKYNGMKAME
jgi:hypothetical protein